MRQNTQNGTYITIRILKLTKELHIYIQETVLVACTVSKDSPNVAEPPRSVIVNVIYLPKCPLYETLCGLVVELCSPGKEVQGVSG
jgi:hypothetical protein